METPATIAPIGGGGASLRSSAGPGASHVGGPARGRTPVGGTRVPSAQAQEQIMALQNEVKEYRTSLEGLEKERDFYFAKLRDIEILVQNQLENLEKAGAGEDETLKEIQKILYSTEVRKTFFWLRIAGC